MNPRHIQPETIHPIDFVIKHEGGFVNDPKDPGGVTKYGISLRFLKTLDPVFADLDQDGKVDESDIRLLTEPAARFFYLTYFHGPLAIDEYSPALGAVLLDTAVNMGKMRAIKILQRAINVCHCVSAGQYPADQHPAGQHPAGHLIVDGFAGPKTKRGASLIYQDELMRAYLLERVFKYAELVRKYPDLNRFLSGWLNRVKLLERFAVKLGATA